MQISPAAEFPRAILESFKPATSTKTARPGPNDRFVWPALPTTDYPFRLVEFESVAPCSAGPLKARLQHGRLIPDDSHSRADITVRPLDAEYVAVSYACGDGPYDKLISLNGRDFDLRQNLHDFLQAYAASPDGCQMLWVDALCIDQENKAERSQQVQFMSKIYTQATKVIAWLGPAADDSDWCLDRIALSDARSSDVRLHDGLAAILKRPMFSRMWCVQEMILPSELVLMCGTRLLAWDTFAVVAGRFDYDFYTDFSRLESLRHTNYKPPVVSKGYEIVQRNRSQGISPRRLSKQSRIISTGLERHTTRKLENLLRCFIGRQCTIKHDYIYALLGLASDFGSTADVVKQLTVDYTISIEDLFDQVITFCGLRYHYDGLFIRKLARAMELSETKMEEVMRKIERINSNVKPDAKQLQAPRSSLEP